MAYCLIAAINHPPQMRKGQIQVVKDTLSFGRQERLSSWLRLEISGVTAQEVKDYQNVNVRMFIDKEVVAQSTQGWRVKLTMNAQAIAIGADGAFNQQLKDYILADPHEGMWMATQVGQTPLSLTVDIAKGQAYDLQQINADFDMFFLDRLEEDTGYKRYYFPNAVVDPAVTAGFALEAANLDEDGYIPRDLLHSSITKAQAVANLVDRLA